MSLGQKSDQGIRLLDRLKPVVLVKELAILLPEMSVGPGQGRTEEDERFLPAGLLQFWAKIMNNGPL